MEKLRQDCIDKALSREDIRQIALAYTTRELVARNYLLAFLIPDYRIGSDGILTFTVDLGHMGEYRYADDTFQERYFSRNQIDAQWSLSSGSIFDYSKFYRDVYTLNSHPDLTLDAAIKVRSIPETQARIADIMLEVNETFPLHGAVYGNNYGTEQTDRHRYGASLEYLNLTRHNDSLSVNYAMGEQRDDYEALTLSYNLPFDFREKQGVRLFVGKSNLVSNAVSPGIDLTGDEEFAGIQYTRRLIDNTSRRLSISAGRIWRRTQDRVRFVGNQIQESILRSAPFDCNLAYQDLTSDQLQGLTYGGIGIAFNLPQWDGSSEDAEFQGQLGRENYKIYRGYLYRHQFLWDYGLALVYRCEGQYSDDPLVSSEQKSIGGIYSVRGYVEDEFVADKGLNQAIELLSPEWDWNTRHINTLKGKIRGLFFYDYGVARDNIRPFTPTDNEEISSIGVGLRISYTDYSQIDFDYGWPLDPTSSSDSSGRAHLSVRLTF